MIYVLPQFITVPYTGLCISTTNNFGAYRELSPFVLKVLEPSTGRRVIFENFWQFTKVYKQHIEPSGLPSEDYYQWREQGFNDSKAHRYPMGKGAIPEYSWWLRQKLGYIQARKIIYATEYANVVSLTNSYKNLLEQWRGLTQRGSNLILLDYDAYDHRKLGMSLIDVINNPKRKMGHAFVLMMMLMGVLEECINSPTIRSLL